jgi:ATP-dependent DNA helicase RecG
MEKTEVLKLIKQGENDTTEFKESFDKETIETVGAFSNTDGGVILIGVSNKGVVKGVMTGKETLASWANQVSQSTDPRVIPDIGIVEIDGKTVVVIEVKEYPIKPVSSKGRCYERVGTSNRSMTPHEIATVHIITSGSSWDKDPPESASMKDIDKSMVQYYIRKSNETGRTKISPREKMSDVLEKAELVKDGKPTRAAILLFSKNPQRHICLAEIHCGRFKDDITIIDDRMVRGSILEQIDDAMEFIQKNTNVRFVMTGKPQRGQVWDYPIDALREAVINAVCHRDYTVSSDVEIRIYEDKLTVYAPGGLPLGMTVEKLYKPHKSVLRNKGIAGVFYSMGLIERWGTGMGKIMTLCKEAGLPEPQFDEGQGFEIIFNKDIYTEEYLKKSGLNERQVQAIKYLKERKNITNKEYQQICNTSERTATRDLADLVKREIFELKGTTGKGTKYILKTPQRRQSRQ